MVSAIRHGVEEMDYTALRLIAVWAVTEKTSNVDMTGSNQESRQLV